jgi:hypothetical protein
MSKSKRLSDLENAAGGADDPGDVQVIIDWDENDEMTSRYIVTFGLCDPIEYTEHEFRRRWPDWKPGAVDVGVNWN